MIQIALAAFLVWGFFQLFDKEKLVDGFTAVAFVLVPALIIFLINMGLLALDGPQWVNYITELGYFIAPFLFLKFPLEYPTSKAAIYAGAVFFITVLTQVVVLTLMNVPLN